MSKKPFVIHWGNHWRRFAGARDGLAFLGTVQRGVAGVGALARTRDGRYVQVNGDIVEPLNTQKIAHVLRMTATEEPQCQMHPLDNSLVAEPPRRLDPVPEPGHPAPASAPKPVVTVKKRRVAVCASQP